MAVDIILISTPNKNIDYPGLSLPMLSGALRNAGFSVEQLDLNVTFRDEILSLSGLTGLLETSLACYADLLRDSEVQLRRLATFHRYLASLQQTFGFESLVEVKRRVQLRDYPWVFEESERFQQLLALFKINRALHYLIDMAVAFSSHHLGDYLTQKLGHTLNSTCAAILAKNPKAVGFSILDIQRAFSIRLIQSLRHSYEGKILVGGSDPTRFPEVYQDHCEAIDVVFDREAEVSLPMLLEALDKPNPSFEHIPGILFRDQKGHTVRNRRKPVDLSSIPTPDFRGLPLHLYLTPALPVQASRGCHWHRCRFCIHWNTYCDYRQREPEKVVKDIDVLVRRHKARYFHFTDDCLMVPQAKRLCRLIRDNDLQIRWLAYFRLEEDLNSGLLEEIWQAGGRVLEMGLESASQRVLQLMHKNISVETAQRIVETASDRGFLVKLFMFHGFPGESLEDARKTVEFTERYILERKIRAFLPLRNRFELLRGSDIYEATIAGSENEIERYWLPSGLFGIRAEYRLRTDEGQTQGLISGFVDRIRSYMHENKIFNTDDENVMLDLLVLDNSPLRVEWRSI